MKIAAGIDLGSTTTKAVLLDESGRVVGQGITNTRSNYEVACAVALEEAKLGATLDRLANVAPEVRDASRRAVRLALHRRALMWLREQIGNILEGPDHAALREVLAPAAKQVLDSLDRRSASLFAIGAPRRSDFFRDLAGEQYLHEAEKLSSEGAVPFERLLGLYDRAVLAVESRADSYDPATLLEESYSGMAEIGGTNLPDWTQWRQLVREATREAIEVTACVGTGYGRQTLPFDPAAIRSEILCHGRGAHRTFPGTRTVLDIGGQDTKAIRVDENGVVTSFQMNDRCAAGCGRYLGYIADELSLGLHELGPLALQAKKQVRVNSTCTVFAGAELRERLALGERREDILAGLHRAIVLRALSLLSRAGGVTNEFTFTGGVSNNPAVTKILEGLIRENYGADVKMNVHADSIFMGALGAAMYGLDAVRAGQTLPPPKFGAKVAPVEVPKSKGVKLAQVEASACEAPNAHAQPSVAGGKHHAHAPVAKVKGEVSLELPAIAPGHPELTAGIDVGASAVKVAITESDGVNARVIATAVQRIRRRQVDEVARAAFAEACERAGVRPEQLRYIASTGDGDAVPFRTGHFYSMTAHARGGQFLVPEARGALDLGALHARAIRIDDHARVLGHRMTSQCASGTGQFLENVARYLGVPLEDVGEVSLLSTKPEEVSSVCAVLSETDVINLVSRGIGAPDVLQGIHVGIASRLAKLVLSARIEGVIALTGGLALDEGLLAALDDELKSGKKATTAPPKLVAHPDAILAGALGAAVLGARRARQLAEKAAAA